MVEEYEPEESAPEEPEVEATVLLMRASSFVRGHGYPWASDLLTALLEPATRSGRLLASFFPDEDMRHWLVERLARDDVSLDDDITEEIMVPGEDEARRVGDPLLGTDHLLLGQLAKPALGTGELLIAHGMTPESARTRARELRRWSERWPEPSRAGTFGAFGIDVPGARGWRSMLPGMPDDDASDTRASVSGGTWSVGELIVAPVSIRTWAEVTARRDRDQGEDPSPAIGAFQRAVEGLQCYLITRGQEGGVLTIRLEPDAPAYVRGRLVGIAAAFDLAVWIRRTGVRLEDVEVGG